MTIPTISTVISDNRNPQFLVMLDEKNWLLIGIDRETNKPFAFIVESTTTGFVGVQATLLNVGMAENEESLLASTSIGGYTFQVCVNGIKYTIDTSNSDGNCPLKITSDDGRKRADEFEVLAMGFVYEYNYTDNSQGGRPDTVILTQIAAPPRS